MTIFAIDRSEYMDRSRVRQMTDEVVGNGRPTLGEVLRNQSRQEVQMNEFSRKLDMVLAETVRFRDLERRVEHIEAMLDRSAVTSGATVRQVFMMMAGGLVSVGVGATLALVFGR